MSVQEWWWEFDSRYEQGKKIKARTEGSGKFSGPEWDEARRKHREKMNGKPRTT